jgi:hypothetical protein
MLFYVKYSFDAYINIANKQLFTINIYIKKLIFFIFAINYYIILLIYY